MIRKFNIIGLLVVVLPVLTIIYIFQQYNILLDYSHYILFAMALLLILAGLSILRYVFEGVQMMVEFIKKVNQGSGAIEKDVSDLGKISVMFSNLLERFERSTDELNQRIIELNSIREMTDVAKTTLNVDELLKLVLEKAMQAVGVRNGSVYIVDASEAEGLRFIAAKPEVVRSDDEKGHEDYSLIKHVIAGGRSLIIEDIESDPRTQRPNNPKYGAPSFISMPICSNEHIIAVLNLSNKEKGGLFSESDERILSIMLGEIGFALENAVLHLKVKEQLAEITDQNSRLEQEIQERKKADERLQKVNTELQEANTNLTKAYEWMRNNRDQLRKHFFKEEIGFLVDREGVIQSITERALKYMDKSRLELIKANFIDLLDEENRKDFKDELRQAWLGITRNTQVVLTRSAEGDKTFEATLTRFTSESKREMLIILR